MDLLSVESIVGLVDSVATRLAPAGQVVWQAALQQAAVSATFAGWMAALVVIPAAIGLFTIGKGVFSDDPGYSVLGFIMLTIFGILAGSLAWDWYVGTHNPTWVAIKLIAERMP